MGMTPYASQVAYIHGGASYCFLYCYFPDALTSLHAHAFTHFIQLKRKCNEQRASSSEQRMASNERPISHFVKVLSRTMQRMSDIKNENSTMRVLALVMVLVFH